MYNYLIKIEYDGSGYVGWQYQKNGKSIQEKIEKALKKILKKNIRIIGAGRTDKGVHASGQFANFKSIKKIDDKKKFFARLVSGLVARMLDMGSNRGKVGITTDQ